MRGAEFPRPPRETLGPETHLLGPVGLAEVFEGLAQPFKELQRWDHHSIILRERYELVGGRLELDQGLVSLPAFEQECRQGMPRGRAVKRRAAVGRELSEP